MTEDDRKDFLRYAGTFGEGFFLRKLGKARWVVEFRSSGFPTVFHTRSAAAAKAREWINATMMARLAASD